MIPYADCINHANVDSSYEIVSRFWRPQRPLDVKLYDSNGEEFPLDTPEFAEKLITLAKEADNKDNVGPKPYNTLSKY